MTSQDEAMADLIGIKFVRMVDGVPLLPEASDEVIDKLKELDVGNKNVIVAGYVKTGNHFLLQILQELGYQRMYGEESGGAKIDTMPIEFQTKEALELMEKNIKKHPDTRFVLNHTHAYPNHLPAKKVKIIFITRDPRAIASSGYAFFGRMDDYKPLFDLYNIKNVDDFARILFQGKMSYGCITQYNDAWKEFAEQHKEAQIHFVSYEDLSFNTARNISEIAEFLDIKDVNVDKVVAGSKFESVDKHFKAPDDPNRKEVKVEYTHLVKRKGKTDTWKSELSEASLKLYQNCFECKN